MDTKEIERVAVTRLRRAAADLLNRVCYGGERIVITSSGKERAALVSVGDLERLLGLFKQLEALVEIQCTNGNWNFDSYNFGYANGLILALSVIKGEKPQFLDAPLQWLEDNQSDINPEPISADECE